MPEFYARSGKIYFEQYGARSSTPILLVHGLGCQVIQWPRSFINGLVSAGYRVVTFDNRDAGLSFEVGTEPPSIPELLQAMNDPSGLSSPYTLTEMAMDAVDLLDHIGQSGAHVVGVSMGGMIAQRLAMHFPVRTFSISCIMSSTGNPDLSPPTADAVGVLANSVAQSGRDESIAAGHAASRVFGGPVYDSVELGIGRFVADAYDRSQRPDGVLRQLGAIMTDGDRRSGLDQLKIPVLAVHGEIDPLVNIDGSVDLVDTVPIGTLVRLKDVGHDMPEPVIPEVVAAIVEHLERAQALR